MPDIQKSIEKFEDLFIIDQMCFDNEIVAAKIEKINKQFNIDIFSLIIFFATGEITYNKIPNYLAREFSINKKTAEKATTMIDQEIIKPIYAKINILRNYTDEFNKDILHQKNYVAEIFEKKLINYLKEDKILKAFLNRRILFLFAHDRNYKNELEKAMYHNDERITKENIEIKDKELAPTISNWIKDFVEYYGTDMFNNLDLVKYLTDRNNTKTLNPKERNDLKELLLTYRNVKFFPESMPNDTGEGWEILPLGKIEELSKARTVAGPPKTASEIRVDELKEEKAEYGEKTLESKAVSEEISREKELEQLKYMARKYREGSLERRAIEEEIEKMEG